MSFVFLASLTACDAERLAGISSADNIGNNSICSELLSCELFNISVDWDIRPVPSKDGSGVVFDFAEGDCFKPCSFQSDTKSTYPAE